MNDLTLSERKAIVKLLVNQYAYELEKRATAINLIYEEHDSDFGEEFLLRLINKLSIAHSEVCLEGV